jgi:large subunit ribosomal protein L24
MAAKIRRDDTVYVLKGKDRGKTGRVREVQPKEQRLVVEGINLVKRHTKPRGVARQGGIIAQEAPMPVSKVALVCERCGPTRVGFSFLEDGTKVRICRKCGEAWPDWNRRPSASS